MTTPSTEYCLIPLTHGKFAKVSPHRFEYLSKFSWHAFRSSKSKNCLWYAARGSLAEESPIFGLIFMHRMVVGLERGDKRVVDHINHRTLDNRDKNLRPATRKENSRNRQFKSRAKKHMKGVWLHSQSQKLLATIHVDGKRIHLGSFPNTPEGAISAASAYDKAAIHHFGEFACLNFKNDKIRDRIILRNLQMTDEIEGTPQKAKRKYVRREPQIVPQQPAAPNPNLIALESGIVPLVSQRLEANQKLRIATAHANQANAALQAAQNEMSEIEGEINYRLQLIGQLKNGGMPVPQTPYVAQNLNQPPPWSPQWQGQQSVPMSSPYNPVIPYPSMPPAPGVSSFPAPNRGLYPDATDRLESAEDVRQFEMTQGMVR